MLKNKIIASVAAILAVTSVSGFSFAITANAANLDCHSAYRDIHYFAGTIAHRGVADANGTSCYVLSGYINTTSGYSYAYGDSQHMETYWISSDYISGSGQFSFRHYGQLVSEPF